MDYTRAGLQAAYFKGFVPLKDLLRSDVLGLPEKPDVEGVYVVLRSSSTTPDFIEDDHPKRRIPVMSTDQVRARWPAENFEILYIGKAPLRGREGERRKGLANRMRELQQYGFAGGTNHFGGRLIWRLADRNRLLICWKCVPQGTAADVESLMIAGFKASNTRQVPPFANVGAAKRTPDDSLMPLVKREGC